MGEITGREGALIGNLADLSPQPHVIGAFKGSDSPVVTLLDTDLASPPPEEYPSSIFHPHYSTSMMPIQEHARQKHVTSEQLARQKNDTCDRNHYHYDWPRSAKARNTQIRCRAPKSIKAESWPHSARCSSVAWRGGGALVHRPWLPVGDRYKVSSK